MIAASRIETHYSSASMIVHLRTAPAAPSTVGVDSLISLDLANAMSYSEIATSGRGPRWYAAKTLPRKEAIAQLHLSRQDFESFCPKIARPLARRARGARTTAVAPAPLFPSYVFVRLDLEHDRWRSVNGTIGVSHLVQFGSHPAHVPAGLVEKLQDGATDNGLIRFDDDLKPGDSVRLTGGSFDGWIGKVLRSESKGRVSVLLDLMSRELSAVVSRSGMMRLS